MDTKQLEDDFQNFIDACNKLRNSANALFQTRMKENIIETNEFTEEELIDRAKYTDNLGNIGSCAKKLRDGAFTKSIRDSIKEIKECHS